MDPRMNISPMYEKCFNEFYSERSMHWNKQPSKLGYSHAFKGRDIPDQYIKRDLSFKAVLEDDNEMMRYFGPALDLCSELEARGDQILGTSTCREVGLLYASKVRKAIRVSYAEFRKLYKQWTEARTLLFWLGSPQLRTVAARTIVRSLGDDCPDDFQGIDEATCPQYLRDWWTENMSGIADADVLIYFTRMKMKRWNGAYEELLELAVNGCPTEFLGETYKVLEEYLYNNVDTALVSSLISENSFGVLKRIIKKNMTTATVDSIVAWLMSDRIRSERALRRAFRKKDGSERTGKSHLESQKQILSWLKSMDEEGNLYDDMSRVPKDDYFRSGKHQVVCAHPCPPLTSCTIYDTSC